MPDEPELDTSWSVAWPRAAHVALDLIEQCAFSMSQSDDSVLRQCVRNAKTAEETVKEYAPWKDTLQSLEDAFKEERAAIAKKAKRFHQIRFSIKPSPI